MLVTLVIKNFCHKGLEKLFLEGSKKGVPGKYTEKLLYILDLLEASQVVNDVNFPGSNLHPLKGNFKGFFAVKITGNWRLIFRFIDGDAFDVNLIDYH